MISYFTPNPADHGKALNTMAKHCFVETFAHLYKEHDLAAFLAQAYGPSGLLKDLADPDHSWRVAAEGAQIVGYLKVGPVAVPAPEPQPGALELKQLYVLQPWQGVGVAANLMQWGIETARGRGAPELYLSVFDHNHRAKRFYTRYGFSDVGACVFQVGDQLDEDRMWRLTL
jgi:GNAT superfamily N-acetyltransferase